MLNLPVNQILVWCIVVLLLTGTKTNSTVCLDPPGIWGNRRITFISGEQGNKCPKGRGTGKQIKVRGTGNKGNIFLILVKHGNHLFQNNRGTGNPLEEPHFQGKMKGNKLL